MGNYLTRTSAFIFLVLAAVLICVAPAVANDDHTLQVMEDQLAGLIDQARDNPLAMAAAIGLDPDKVLADLPEMADLLQDGLPPLQREQVLDSVARLHTADMLANDFYGPLSSDGRALTTRLLDAGYDATTAEESLGVLGFINFIDPEKAVFQIFATLYRSELDPVRARPRVILSADPEDLGIGFGSGRLTLGGTGYNVYLVTVDAASRLSPQQTISAMERQLEQMINQFRARPREICNALGIDLEAFIAANPGFAAVLDRPRYPLIAAASLESAAVGHVHDMLSNNFIGHIASDGRDLPERMGDAGYEPYLFGESIGVVGYPAFSQPGLAIKALLTQLVSGELNQYADYNSLTLLSGQLQDLGIGLEAGTFQSADGPVDVLLGDITLGASDPGARMQAPRYVTGAVYTDENGNGLDDLGEGLSGVQVMVQCLDADGAVTAARNSFTNGAGGFMIPFETSATSALVVTISVPNQEPVTYTVAVTTADENVWLEHRLTAP